MPTKHNFLKLFSILAILAILFSNTQPPVAQAQSGSGGDRRRVTTRGGDGVNRKVNARSGKVSFIGPEKGHALAAAEALQTSIRPQDPAMALAKRFAPEFGIQNPERDLKAMKSHRGQDGRVTARYQQTYQGIPVMGGELIVNTNDNGDLYSMNGEVSPDISLSAQPTIDSATAKATALQEVAKSYQKKLDDFVSTEPALWIYDESLLKESTRPIELVWRMDVMAKDNAMPVRELVLVNAQSGDVSLHFNQIDTEWKADTSPTSTPEPPQSTEPPVATDVPESGATPSALAEQSSAELITGNTLYVTTTGSDGNSCSTSGAPCATINGAIGKATAGDMIKVTQGTYIGNSGSVVNITKSLSLSGGWDSSFISQVGFSFVDGGSAYDGIDINSTVDVNISNFIVKNSIIGISKTFGGNLYFEKGALIGNRNAIYNYGNTTFINTTISDNDGYCCLAGSAISNVTGTVNIQYSTIANNTGVASTIWSVNGAAVVEISDSIVAGLNNSNCMANLISDGHNIFSSSPVCAGSVTSLSDKVGVDPNLFTVIVNGGFYPPKVGSPALDAASAICPVSDQRGKTRPTGAGCDVGAVEHQNSGIIPAYFYAFQTTSQFTKLNSTFSSKLKALVLDANGDSVPGQTVTFTAPANGASAIFASTGTNVSTTLTDASGIATSSVISSNSMVGSYIVQTVVAGLVNSVDFQLTNSNAQVRTYTANNGTAIPGIFLCDQTNANCTNGINPHADAAHTYAIGTYSLYSTEFNRDSIDNVGMTITSTVHYGYGYDNAYWSGTQMVYGDAHGYALADDVVAHELTHGVTQYESDLFYYFQSGAINESMSDVFGEYYDQTNGLGNDTAGAKWQMGEDIIGLGVLRSMSNPPAFGDPDKMSSSNYLIGGDDNGGVHENSGVNNKAVYLMVDGDTFNGKTVTGIGWNKVGAIYYEANTNLLTSASDYSDLYYALQQACTNLLGTKGITTADCAQVKNALDAVEMNYRQAFGNVDDPSFEDSYSYYPYWDQSSTNFGSPLCIKADCVVVDDGTMGPRTGSVWGWFGGTTKNETAWLSQMVYFPRGYPSIKLKFYLWIGRANAGSDANDKFTAQVDGKTVFTANATQKNSYSSYKQVVVDVSSFARNARHTIKFTSVTTKQVVNFNLDDVSLEADLCTISGNAGVAGAVLKYMDGITKTVIADGSGNYSITVLNGWSGRVTPYLSGYTFTPGSRSYTNVQSNQVNQNYIAQVCLTCADVNVLIEAGQVGNYTVAPVPAIVDGYDGAVGGPVKVVSTNGRTIFASQQAIYGNSFNELMGYPANKFSTEYWFPWYDQVNMRTWILVGNPSTTQTAYVDIYIAGARRPDTTGAVKTYSIAPGQNITPQFPGMVNGPVRVVSVTGTGTPTPINIFASERSLYGVSFNEVMGYPVEQFTTEYWFPWYDQVNMSSWLLVGNPSTTETAYVDIYIGGVKRADTTHAVQTYAIPPGQNITPQFPGIVDGAVQVVSVTGTGTPTPVNIFTSERSLYGTSFNEVMGYPTDQLTSDYYFPWYDNHNMTTWVLVGNPSTTQKAYVDIYIGGAKRADTTGVVKTYTIDPGQNVTPQFTFVSGPVHVVSVTGSGTPTPLSVFTSERVIYKTSFNEMMGYPANQLTSEYWFTWYDNLNMKTSILVGTP